MVHQVVAIGSRSLSKAEAFVTETNADRSIVKVYGTYEEVHADPVGKFASFVSSHYNFSSQNVDIVYIGGS